MANYTDLLYSFNNLDAADEGETFSVRGDRSVTHVPVALTLSAGTISADIQGRMSSADEWVTLTTLTTDGSGELVARFPEMRVNVTAATDAVGRITVGCRVKQIS